MKTDHVRSITVATALLLSALISRADVTSYAAILKERDAVLSQILTQREASRATGLADEEAIWAAQLALYSFRRDTGSTAEERLKQQGLIVGLCEKKLGEAKERMKSGIGGGIDVLLATDKVLQAKQVMEELKLNGKKG